MKTIQDRIRALRMENETQIQFAERLGTTQASISRYLNGRQPDRETLIRIADRTNVSLDWLLTGKGRGPGDGGSSSAHVTSLADSNGLSSREKSQLEALINDVMNDREKRREILSFYESINSSNSSRG